MHHESISFIHVITSVGIIKMERVDFREIDTARTAPAPVHFSQSPLCLWAKMELRFDHVRKQEGCCTAVAACFGPATTRPQNTLVQ